MMKAADATVRGLVVCFLVAFGVLSSGCSEPCEEAEAEAETSSPLSVDECEALAGKLAGFVGEIDAENDEDPEGDAKVAGWCREQGLSGENAVTVMTAVLSQKDVRGRGFVIRALGKTGDKRAVDPLLTMLRDEGEHPWLRWEVARALGKLEDTRVVPTLIKTLSHEKAPVRMGSACALGWLGDTRAVAPLINALADDVAGVRVDVCDALHDLGDKRARDPLRTLLKTETDEKVIAAADKAIAVLEERTP